MAVVMSIATAALFLAFGGGWLADLRHPAWFATMFGWLFAAILLSAFAVCAMRKVSPCGWASLWVRWC